MPARRRRGQTIPEANDFPNRLEVLSVWLRRGTGRLDRPIWRALTRSAPPWICALGWFASVADTFVHKPRWIDRSTSICVFGPRHRSIGIHAWPQVDAAHLNARAAENAPTLVCNSVSQLREGAAR